MILQLIFTIPQLIAKLLNYSETDFGAGYSVNKVDGHLNTRMGPPTGSSTKHENINNQTKNINPNSIAKGDLK